MKRKDVDPALIDWRDANAKALISKENPMNYLNVKSCACFNPNVGGHHLVLTTNPKHVFLCDKCSAALNARISDPVMISGMLKSAMTEDELKKMRSERDNMRIEEGLARKVRELYDLAGYPRHLALEPPVAA